MFGWGSTKNGELGLGGIEEELILAPRQLNFPQATEIAQVSCGVHHTVLVTTSGRAYSCGSNDHAQLGHDKSCKRPELVDSLSGLVLVSAACGLDFTLALDEWGRVHAWGADDRGQLGAGAAGGGAVRPAPKIVKGLATSAARVVQIAAGHQHCLALANNGELTSWGCNAYGQLGRGTVSNAEGSPSPIGSLNGLPIAYIACGANHSFAISKSGAVYGWGKNSFGQLGLNDEKDRSFPCHLKTLRTVRVKYAACGEDFSVFLTADGGVFTCGAGMYGQLGHGTLNNELLPRKVLELMGSTVTQVACGRRHTLAFVPSRGRVYAFGLGGSGQLGTRVACNASTPQVVLGPWVSPSGVCMIQDLPPGSTTLNLVRAVFAGGDGCFAATTCYLDNVAPEDYRLQPPRTRILGLCLDRVKECKRAVAGQPSMDLVEYLELLFNSQSCINGSLLLPNDEHYCCTTRNHGVDMAAALLCFQVFANVTNTTILELVLNIMVSTLQSLPPSPPDIEALRLYLTLPLYHEFDNPANWEALQNPFGQALISLKTEAGQIVVDKWWTLMPQEYLERLVHIYKGVVLHVLNLNTSSGPLADGCHRDQYVALEILALLYKTNKAMDQPIIPYETFYIPEIRDKVNVQEDYYRWWLQKTSRRVWFCHYPFLFDAEGKTILLETDQQIQMRSAMNSAATRALTTYLFDPAVGATMTAFLELQVGRGTIVADTIRELGQLGPSDLKKPLKVKFFGEEAEDAGGVRKEFFMLLMGEILDPKYGMFRRYDETRTVWFSEDSYEEGAMYYLIGILCGLAIYNFTIINLPFPLALYKKLLNVRVTLQDLKGLSPSLAKSFQDILDYEGSDFEQVFDLTFEVSREVYGEVKTMPLKPDGGQIPVTQRNKEEFIRLYVDLLLNTGVETQFKSFYRGFHQVCGGKVLEMFQAEELMAVVVGNENYDWNEMERLTEYKGGYAATDKTIKWFWEVFRELTLEDKKKFLMFLTGCDRIPISGMKSIKVTIQATGDDKCLPVAHTCFNLLDLPRYSTKEKLRYKLLQAIQQNLGFSLV